MGAGGANAAVVRRVAPVVVAVADSRGKRPIFTLEERIAVLERIATDPAERTAREIEKLR